MVLLRCEVGDLSGVAPPIGVLKWFSSNVNTSSVCSLTSPTTSVFTTSTSPLRSSTSLLFVATSSSLDGTSIGFSGLVPASFVSPSTLSSTSLVSLPSDRLTSLAQTTSSSSCVLLSSKLLPLLSQSVSLILLVVVVSSCSLSLAFLPSSGERAGVEKGVGSVELFSALVLLTSPCRRLH